MPKFKAGRKPKPGPPYRILKDGWQDDLDKLADEPWPIYSADPRWPGWLFIAVTPNQMVTSKELGKVIGSKIARFRGEPAEAEKAARTEKIQSLRAEKKTIGRIVVSIGESRSVVTKALRKSKPTSAD
jgi:hypothetical protein